jgi:hypothetical protein
MASNILEIIEKERKEISRSEEDEEKKVIRLKAIDCNFLLDSSLARTADSSQALLVLVMRFLRDYKRRFEGWCSYMCVITEHKNTSLDNRLQNHLSLQDIVMRLLNILQHNLLILSNYKLPDHSYNPCNSEAELPAGLQVDLDGTRESIHRLNNLRIAIKTSSRSNLVARARRSANQYVPLHMRSDSTDNILGVRHMPFYAKHSFVQVC